MPISIDNLKKVKEHSNCFVETGTHMGASVDKAINLNFKVIKSVESDLGLYLNCVEKYKYIDSVSIYHGDSFDSLGDMIFDIKERIVFWLDAHAVSSKIDKEDVCPILKELDEIAHHQLKNHIILIDDVRLFRKSLKHEGQVIFNIDLNSVIESLKRINKEYKIIYFDGFSKSDILAAIPPDLSHVDFNKKIIPKAPPPKAIPKELINKYTINGEISIQYRYFDDSKTTRKIWNSSHINQLINQVKLRRGVNYPNVDIMLYDLFKQYKIKGKNVLIVGSENPFYEAMCIHFGANKITVSEYNIPICDDRRVKYVDPLELKDEKFDVIFSISSLEHDGLGRYGDQLNPNGDIEFMKSIKSNMKKESLLFLSVPIGLDCLVWNVHRVYGKIRLPMILNGFQIIWSSFDCDGAVDKTIKSHIPTNELILLKNTEIS